MIATLVQARMNSHRLPGKVMLPIGSHPMIAHVLERSRRGVVVRITGDCPLVDPGLGDQVVAMFQAGRADYVSNIHPPTFPDGLDVEITSMTGEVSGAVFNPRSN
jgi:spore coat polysaccharide biosynthesis protein SpsF (cytidylyltransferase family)